jgi:hypothetical protein
MKSIAASILSKLIILIKRFISWWLAIFKKQNTKGKWRFGCLTIFCIVFIFQIPMYVNIVQTAPTRATQTAMARKITPSIQLETVVFTNIPDAPTIQPTISETKLITPTQIKPVQKTSTPSANVEPLIPGLTTGDLTARLKQKGFDCLQPEKGELYYVRTCNLEDSNSLIRVDIYGREMLSIDFVESGVLQYDSPDPEYALAFFGYMSKLPYTNSKPQEAYQWVKTMFPTLKGQGDVREKTIENVKFTLYGIPTAYMFGIGDLP